MNLSPVQYSEIFDVRTGLGTVKDGAFSDTVATVTRVPIQRSGYQLVRFKNKKYVLRGGFRTNHFICLNNPVKGRVI